MNRSHRGFTLVELLVVCGIMAVMFSLIVVNGSPRPTALRAAQDFASVLLAAQSRALGKPQGAAVIIGADSEDPQRFGSVVHEGDSPPPIVMSTLEYGVHEDFPDLVTLGPVGPISTTMASIVRNSYKMQIRRATVASGNASVNGQYESPWYGVRLVTLYAADGSNGYKTAARSDVVGLPVRRNSAGQSATNSTFAPPDTFVEPAGSRLGNYEAVLIRHPTIGLNATKIDPSLAIALEFSGVGNDLAASHGYGSFNGTTSAGMCPLAIVFDQTGRVSEVIRQVAERDLSPLTHGKGNADANPPPNPPPNNQDHLDPDFPSCEHPEWRDPALIDPIVPNETIYFLFVDRNAIRSDTPLGSESAAWVALDPLTGRISVSSNVPSPTRPVPDVFAARERARQAAAFGK